MTFVFVLVLWIASVCVHEYAHARVAYLAGDTSVEQKGYLSLNPLRYADPVVSVVFPVLFAAIGGIGLPGGAVYIDRARLRGAAWDSLVSAAGPMSNLAIAGIVGVVLYLGPVREDGPWPALAFFGLLQVTAFVLNLLPIPPLDGFGILAPYLSPTAQEAAARFGRISIWLVFLVLWYSAPIGSAFWQVVYAISGSLGIPDDLAYSGYRAFRVF